MFWGLLFRKAEECFKYCLMGLPSKNMEDSGAEDDLNCGRWAQEVSEKNFSMLPRGHSCGILVKNVATILPFSKESA